MQTRINMISSGVFLVCLLIPFAVRPQSPIKEFVIKNPTIEFGDSTEITWSVAPNTQVYISGIGTADTIGTLHVKATQSTSLTLVVESQNEIFTKTTYLHVTGERGFDDIPDEDEFRYSRTVRQHGRSYIKILDAARFLLQDSLRFICKEYSQSPGQYSILTNKSQKTNLVPGDLSSGIRARRLAYHLSISKEHEPGKYLIAVKTLIEFQRRGESRWNREQNESFFDSTTDLLIKKLSARLKSTD